EEVNLLGTSRIPAAIARTRDGNPIESFRGVARCTAVMSSRLALGLATLALACGTPADGAPRGAAPAPASAAATIGPADTTAAVGTMRYQLLVTQGDRAIASAGQGARRGRGAGGLSDDVHRVTIRRDDSFLGYLTEMYGQPYIWASAGATDRTHQSERLEGSD